jgi:hypothetical protein
MLIEATNELIRVKKPRVMYLVSPSALNSMFILSHLYTGAKKEKLNCNPTFFESEEIQVGLCVATLCIL